MKRGCAPRGRGPPEQEGKPFFCSLSLAVPACNTAVPSPPGPFPGKHRLMRNGLRLRRMFVRCPPATNQRLYLEGTEVRYT